MALGGWGVDAAGWAGGVAESRQPEAMACVLQT